MFYINFMAFIAFIHARIPHLSILAREMTVAAPHPNFLDMEAMVELESLLFFLAAYQDKT